ncbi:MAG: outer membrane protein assembly factor BamD [Chelatococcus sp.]|jgi:outer membrane protein assembly factor BamD|uniref:outer membrane protein assembly factor BamD n=1 Tax=unclassified Chelatococcus TaxID=2638111 RepID=UPI001BCE1480|nr:MULTISPECIES: outer membrane protein assembly factor BamD [unclassified Chelatococcus]CAH1666518.1 Outer membrane protein assembly factor BamD [Hyphomicrobiales bacterium]MBS7737864.1 outer membrane protein assembly factor BamD [Chelatococcus sp. HY11]MBX3538831.1 outer membrane protein assembly factor BamD [Chelatococcus sp.]MBX3546688.1 outer membrane protein assembly factor BamD [Chelatococcus sp.]MCO5079318.1 outer membrane protein assembly factor BamD [Chelatococcus sp.]
MYFSYLSKIGRSGCRAALLRGTVLVVASIPLAGCDSLSSLNPFDKAEKYKPEIIPEVPGDQIYNEGLAHLDKRNYSDAAKKFDALDKQYPYSQWSQKALIMNTYANYEGGAYDDAANSARRYLALHPASQDAAYAQYLLAMSYYKEVPDVSRDQERAEKALTALQELVDRYPKSEYVADAKFKIQVLRDQLAGKEMEVGRYYLKQRNYTAAINRFRIVVSKYQTTRHVEEALERLVEAYMALGIVAEAQTAAAVLGHNFPDSQWYKDAYALLAKDGIQPREDTGSWISKLFSSGRLG